MRILLISHQLAYSGAPLALLELARALHELGHEIFLATFARGPLEEQFLSLQVRPWPAEGQAIDMYIANTVLCVPAALSMAPSPDSVLAWIHETGFFFRILGADARAFSLQKLKFAAFPARFQTEEFAQWMPATTRLQLRNCVRIPERDLLASPGEYYVCTGNWEARKGQSRLLQLTHLLPTQPVIWFVGADPPLGMQSTIHRFLGSQSPLQAKRIIAQAKGLISASVAEAQPLAPIEAAMAGRPVLLSDIPAHRELKEALPDILLFDPDRPQSFIDGFHALNRQAADPDVGSRLRAAARHYFNPESFLENVKDVLSRMTLPHGGGC